MTRPTLSLIRACNNACVFCAQDGLPPLPAGSVRPQLEQLRAGGAAEVTFVGGEPTLREDLAGLVQEARALGFERVGLQTNGRLLASEPFTAALASAGLTDVHLSVLGGEAEVHDYHTGVEGSFRAVIAGMGVARALGLQVVATTVVTRSNYRVLNAIPALLVSRGVLAWQVTAPLVAGRAVAAMDRVVPRLALAVPYALHALDAGRKQGLRIFAGGLPSCLLGPFVTHALPGAPRGYAPQCEGCPQRARCPGVDPTYLARFGTDELSPPARPLDPAPITPRGASSPITPRGASSPITPRGASSPIDALARLFTGPGEVFVPSELTVPAPPAKVREQLAELGKGTPATAEVSSRDRKSGDALRGLFPKLFEPKDG